MLTALMLVIGFSLSHAALAQPFVVTNNQDAGAGSLRQAIIDANANLGPDIINFDITEVPPIVIAPVTNLPPITESVLIDGYSQPGTLVNTATEGSNAEIHIVLSGALVENPDPDDVETGLKFEGGASEVRGVSFVDWDLAVELAGDGNHVLSGNWFGISPAGSAMYNDKSILITADNCVVGAPLIGPPQLADRNLIGNSVRALLTSSSAQDIRIQNNFIGTDPSGSGPMPNVTGLALDGVGLTVGGLGPQEANVVTWTAYAGIAVEGQQATIRGNRIFNNRLLGIDLADNGVSKNDPPENLDSDSGPNGLQNYPVLISVANKAGGIEVSGVLDSAAGTTFDIDFYSNSVRDSGPPDSMGRFHGEGEAFLGTTQVTTDGAGHADFNLVLTETAVGAWISATATDPDGNTSEFSTTIPVPGESCTVTNANASGKGSFDACLIQLGNNGNNAIEIDHIEINIPDVVEVTVPHNDDTAPFSPNLHIDFTTQPGFIAPNVDNPCEGGVWPATIHANPPDIDVFNNTLIDGIDVVGSAIIKSGAGGVSISDSRMTATLVGAGLFLDGDLTHVRNSTFVPMGDLPGLAVTGDLNRIVDVCVHNSVGIFAGGSGNTFERPTVVLDSETGAIVYQGTGNRFFAVNTENATESPTGQGILIDLGDDGHTENDPLDADEGPNDLQNHPVIESATSLAGAAEGAIQSRIEGVLDSEPASEYRIEAYANAACAANDYGPAERYLGFTEVTTDSAGHATFTLESTEAVAEGEVVVASATSLSGSTSELSACVSVTPGNPGLIFGHGFESP